ncbi:MAG: tRNA lysidine(34) synthetase TilS [Candidatus Tokpelaia sp.]|nr:MAG: tRNA lysidine(34) synthetase TilS [Candidatus Tokpelaia sp.]KAA6206792.1 MAG: tRNA lysidine(34) synthetase TilS [Candidatus Tokpelaia sp.]
MPMRLIVPKPEILTADNVFEADDFAGQNVILAAVSGGGDSLALLLLLAEFLRARGQQKRLAAVTIDHDLRAESAAEAAYVGRLCRRLAIRHEILLWEGVKPATGRPAAARAARYALLAQAAAKYQAVFICTAHTLDDQIETYIMRKARLAAGAKDDNFAVLKQRGLAGMARQSLLFGRFRLVRPLLNVKRAALRRFLRYQNISWVDDPSNSDEAYERARIRAGLSETAARPACQALAAAAAARQNLSAAAALWGKKLSLRGEGEKLLLDLAPIQAADKGGEEAGSDLGAPDFAALYLLLAYAAAAIGGKNFIAVDNARLQHFLQHLPLRQKGEAPRRISVSGAVLEKRGRYLNIRPERRRLLPGRGSKTEETAFMPGAAPFNAAPFSFILSGYDWPLFALLQPFFPANTVEIEKISRKKAAFL